MNVYCCMSTRFIICVVTAISHILAICLKCVLPMPELVWEACKLRGIMSSWCTGIPWGFPLISHHTPAVIPTLWREGICHLAACFPLPSQEQSWALIYCEVSPGSLSLRVSSVTEWRKQLTTRMTFLLDDYYPGQCKDWLRSCLFLPCHPCSFTFSVKAYREFSVWVRNLSDMMMQDDLEKCITSLSVFNVLSSVA